VKLTFTDRKRRELGKKVKRGAVKEGNRKRWWILLGYGWRERERERDKFVCVRGTSYL